MNILDYIITKDVQKKVVIFATICWSYTSVRLQGEGDPLW
jgi:hypothetical protein